MKETPPVLNNKEEKSEEAEEPEQTYEDYLRNYEVSVSFNLFTIVYCIINSLLFWGVAGFLYWIGIWPKDQDDSVSWLAYCISFVIYSYITRPKVEIKEKQND